MRYDPWLHRFALFTAVNTFVLIFLGGLVTSTGSGLSVPDWPTTYGENMFTFPIDKWVGGIKYEHGHRLFASYVGLLTTVLAVWLGLKAQRPWLKRAGYSALVLVIVQGILGGLTVLYLLPTPVSVAHGMTAQSFLCLVSIIALGTSSWWTTTTSARDSEALRTMSLVMTAASAVIFVQLALGALLRHTYSGLSVPDFPLAYGQLFPSLDADALASYQQQLLDDRLKFPGDRPVQAYQIVIHMLHRSWAYIAAAVLLAAGTMLRKGRRRLEGFERHGALLIGSVLIQFTLGALTVLSRKEILITTAHVAVGAATLVVCVVTAVQLHRLRRLAQGGMR